MFDAFFDEKQRELWAFCYQMLGSPFDAEDAVQDVFERVWRAQNRFDAETGSVSGWVFRIARNVCVDRLRSAGRRTLPRDLGDPDFEVGAPLVPRVDTRWLQPAPSSWLGEDRTADAVVRSSDVRLAVTALLQALPARQRAVFVLRELLGYSSAEAAATLGTSVPAINSALQRARRVFAGAAADSRPERGADETARVVQYARAFEAGDAAVLAQLVTEDVVLEMPPLPQWLRGRGAYQAFMADLFRRRGDRWQTRLISANYQPGLLLYRVTDDGVEPHTLHVVTGGAGGLLSHLLVYQDPDLFALFERSR